MIDRDSIKIPAAAEEIWPYVAYPTGIAVWNPKVIDVRRTSRDAVRTGELFEVVYRMSGRETLSHVEVLAAEPYSKVIYRHSIRDERSGRGESRRRRVDETYVLEARKGGVLVTQKIDLSDAGIPWFFLPLVWFISRFGKSVGKSYMQSLKEAVLNP